MTWVLLPLKSLGSGKQRLSGLLTPVERLLLVEAMAEDMLGALQNSEHIEQIWIVSDDLKVQQLAERYSARVLTESSLGAKGLNPVVSAATEELYRRGCERLLVLHGDLPMIAKDDLDSLFAAAQPLVLATDRAGTGSNAMLFSLPAPIPFQYGEGSCQRHQASCDLAGIDYQIMQTAGLSCDVDSWEDLRVLLQSETESAAKTLAFLRQGDIAERVAAVSAESINNEDRESVSA